MTDFEPPMTSEPDAPGESTEPDLDAIERDLDGVQAALGRLAEDAYWTDEITGEPIPVDKLEADPLTRRA